FHADISVLIRIPRCSGARHFGARSTAHDMELEPAPKCIESHEGRPLRAPFGTPVRQLAYIMREGAPYSNGSPKSSFSAVFGKRRLAIAIASSITPRIPVSRP